MTRVHGLLFDDRRNGILAIQPSVPFFGCQRHEKHYEVVDGEIDIELLPTPRGIVYNVGFKGLGDTRRTEFTLKWRIQNVPEIDISPVKKEEAKPQLQSERSDRVQVKRLASELSAAMEKVTSLEAELNSAHKQLAEVSTKFEAYKSVAEQSLVERDLTISTLQGDNQPQVHTVVKEVPVPPERLEARIKSLESELLRTQELNSQYYLSVLELHQLKLDKAQTISSIPAPSVEDSPRQRLLNKLLAK